uniref:Uncharacterized protein n=1 Tax=Gadus morhua TaxID=8049 RepID=A0A8C5BZ18_GADMO
MSPPCDNQGKQQQSQPSNSLPSSPVPVPAAEGEPGQRGADVDTAGQQLRLKERRFFEEVFQHDVDMYLSAAHLAIREHRRPPIGSISSMEVNVDLLDQMEHFDISDQDAFDVFFSSGEESMLNSPLPGTELREGRGDKRS